MGIDVAISDGDKTLILDLLTKLKAGFTADVPSKAAKTERPASMSDEEWKAQRRKEARDEEKAAARKEKAHSALLAQELKAEVTAGAVAASKEAKAKNAAKGGPVRVTLCSAEKPSDRKTVVLPRAPDVAEVLKVAKAKLKLKKALGVRLLEDGSPVRTTAELDDGAVLAVGAEPTPAEEATPPEAAAVPDAAALGPPTTARPPTEATPVCAAADATVAESPATRGAEMGAGDDAPLADATEAQIAAIAPAAAPPKAAPTAEPAPTARARVTALPRIALDSTEAAAEQARLLRTRPPAAMVAARASLPMYGHRDAVLSALEGSRAMVLQGEPGCGKSTQVPQFILDSDPASRIVVTQPRRLAARAGPRRRTEIVARRAQAVGRI